MAKAGGTYVIEGTASSTKGKVFRSSKSGQFVTTVMSKASYKTASGKANTAIRKAEGAFKPVKDNRK